jgi:hypothetical protein
LPKVKSLRGFHPRRLFLLQDNQKLSRRVQSGSTGCADKTGSYAILPLKTATALVKNL